MRALSHLIAGFKNASKTKKFFITTLLVVFVASCGLLGYLVGIKKLGSNLETISPKGNLVSGPVEEPRNFPNPITGVLFKKSEAQAWVNQLPLAVMIENHTDARPQTGLSKADIVYEALAEGGITRFMAVFLQNNTPLGPIRSARPYYLDWASEYDAAYVHYGGSPFALNEITRTGIKNLDGIGIGEPVFHRISSRPEPHNVYSTTQQLRAEAAGKGYKKGKDIVSWSFLDQEAPLAQRPASFSLKLGFLGTYGYDVEWRYNRDTNSYFRFNGGAGAFDASDNSQLQRKTIIVETVSYSYDPSGHGRLFMDTIGSGSLKVFENGTIIEGTWRKDSPGARTELLDRNGQPIKLVRGQIWVDIVPPGSTVNYQ